ncbi:MAG: ribonuclease H-like domain-containing protein [Bacteroidetes bacterium]|nr:ribonuclease H-like domain-containing protein [Bacteroidota bacterium]
MKVVVFDIETVGISWDTLTEHEQAYLLKSVKSDEEAEAEKGKLGLNPLTGKVVSIAMYNPDSKHGRVLLEAEGNAVPVSEPDEDGFQFVTGTEEELLKAFWDMVKSYDAVITFNGRAFDAPYLLLRSMTYGILPTKNLLPYRFSSKEHIDLMDVLTFYGITRKFSLDFYCRRLGIPTPKTEAASGDKVAALYAEGKLQEIGIYNKLDVIATNSLFQMVKPTLMAYSG